MIKYNNSNINDWNFGDDNIIKVYKHGAVVFYKFDSEQGGYKVCFAVVDDITLYSDTEFEDVYDKATEKWYKLNNLNTYEEYGVYGSGRSVTTYEGKLTIDDGYEYEWNGSSWVNIGEVSGSSITIKSPEYLERNSSHTGYCDLLETLTEDTKIIIKHRQTNGGGYAIIGDYYNTDNDDWRVLFASSTLYYDFITQRKSTRKTLPMQSAEEWEIGNYYIKNTATGTNYLTGNAQTFSSRPNQMYLYYLANAGSGPDYGEVYYIKIFRNDVLVRDFIPWTDMNGNYGLYDKVENQLVQTTGQMTASTVINDVTIGSEVYPKYYSEKSEPLDNLTFNTLAEAQAYAEANCVYVGLKATINGDKYVFSGDSQSGYEWVEQSYTQYEYIRTSNPAYYTIDTGFYPTTANTIEVKFEMVESVDWGNIVAWGVLGNTAHSTSLQFATVTTRYKAIVRTGGNNGATYRPTIGANNTTVYTLPLSATSGTYSVNGGPTNTIRYNINSSFNLPSIVSMRILGGYGNDNGDIKNYKSACGKLYYVKVYDGNGNIVKHYVPSDYNGSPCLYEIVDGNYILDTYTGSSHGTLTLGPQV